jgi:hypothetical protein
MDPPFLSFGGVKAWIAHIIIGHSGRILIGIKQPNGLLKAPGQPNAVPCARPLTAKAVHLQVDTNQEVLLSECFEYAVTE